MAQPHDKHTSFVPASQFTDAHIDAVRDGGRNVIVAFGFLGDMRCFLNPSSAQAAIDACQKEVGVDPREEGYTAIAIGFDDSFSVYDIGRDSV